MDARAACCDRHLSSFVCAKTFAASAVSFSRRAVGGKLQQTPHHIKCPELRTTEWSTVWNLYNTRFFTVFWTFGIIITLLDNDFGHFLLWGEYCTINSRIYAPVTKHKLWWILLIIFESPAAGIGYSVFTILCCKLRLPRDCFPYLMTEISDWDWSQISYHTLLTIRRVDVSQLQLRDIVTAVPSSLALTSPTALFESRIVAVHVSRLGVMSFMVHTNKHAVSSSLLIL